MALHACTIEFRGNILSCSMAIKQKAPFDLGQVWRKRNIPNTRGMKRRCLMPIETCEIRKSGWHPINPKAHPLTCPFESVNPFFMVVTRNLTNVHLRPFKHHHQQKINFQTAKTGHASIPSNIRDIPVEPAPVPRPLPFRTRFERLHGRDSFRPAGYPARRNNEVSATKCPYKLPLMNARQYY